VEPCKVVVTEVYIEKTSKQFLKWSKYNLGELEGVRRLGSANTLSKPSYKSVVCNQYYTRYVYIHKTYV
jgi:hypothetical protein